MRQKISTLEKTIWAIFYISIGIGILILIASWICSDELLFDYGIALVMIPVILMMLWFAIFMINSISEK